MPPPICSMHGTGWDDQCNVCWIVAPRRVTDDWVLAGKREPDGNIQYVQEPNRDPISTYECTLAYLRSLKATTWPPKTFKLQGKLTGIDDIVKAAEWLTKVNDAVNGIRNMAMSSDKTLDEVAEMYRRMSEGETYHGN